MIIQTKDFNATVYPKTTNPEMAIFFCPLTNCVTGFPDDPLIVVLHRRNKLPARRRNKKMCQLSFKQQLSSDQLV
jgi:hypothetical protein